jgi:hypothetical protein
MMYSDDVPHSMPFQQGRKPLPPNKYQDNRYSPSANYNYNYKGNGGFSSQQQRRRIDRYNKRDNGNSSERLLRQNDLIIRLLKEIRDRLPPPAVPAHYDNGDSEPARQNGRCGDEAVERAEAPATEAAAPEANVAAAAVSAESEPLKTGSEQPKPDAITGNG